jgi:YidC/Oxa1 family membrane protein insertase
MDRQALIAIVLSALVLIGYQFFFAPPPVQTPPPVAEKAVEKKSAPEVPPVAVPAVAVAAATVADERDIRVENDLYCCYFYKGRYHQALGAEKISGQK